MKKNQFNDFRNFVYVVWRHLSLPEPTKLQYSICEYLQEDNKRIVIEGYRGIGKSFLTAAFTLWQLFLNPQLNTWWYLRANRELTISAHFVYA